MVVVVVVVVVVVPAVVVPVEPVPEPDPPFDPEPVSVAGGVRSRTTANCERCSVRMCTPEPSLQYPSDQPAGSVPGVGTRRRTRQVVPSKVAPATFVAGSVLISPARAADPNPATRVFGDDLELVHHTVRARINATRNPLNAASGAVANRPCAGVALPTPTPATNFPAGTAPTPPTYSSWIVGLYENGFEFDCDVYRPTGVCLMRTLHYLDAPTVTESAYQFCPVCRYAMVDFLDPSKHGAVDADYAPRYPT